MNYCIFCYDIENYPNVSRNNIGHLLARYELCTESWAEGIDYRVLEIVKITGSNELDDAVNLVFHKYGPPLHIDTNVEIDDILSRYGKKTKSVLSRLPGKKVVDDPKLCVWYSTERQSLSDLDNFRLAVKEHYPKFEMDAKTLVKKRSSLYVIHRVRLFHHSRDSADRDFRYFFGITGLPDYVESVFVPRYMKKQIETGQKKVRRSIKNPLGFYIC